MLKKYLRVAKKGSTWQVPSAFVVKALTITMSLMTSMTIKSMKNIHDILLDSYTNTLSALSITFVHAAIVLLLCLRTLDFYLMRKRSCFRRDKSNFLSFLSKF